MRRLAGQGGDPVVAAADQFRRRQDALDAGALPPVLRHRAGRAAGHRCGPEGRRGGASCRRSVKRVVLVGNKISPGNPSVKSRRHGGADAVGRARLAARRQARRSQRVAADDERATSPGDALRELMNEHGPCLILIDEWVAYARQLHDEADLPAGSFETHFTFAQALTESAKLARQLPAGHQPAGLRHGDLAARAGRRRGGRRRARPGGAGAAAQRHRAGGVVLGAGQHRGRVRDRPPAAVRAADREGAVRRRATRSRAPSTTSTAPSIRSSRPSAATSTTRRGSRPPTRSIRKCSTGSTPTGRRW